VNPDRFDALAKRLSRRTALVTGGGLAAVFFGAFGTRRAPAAQSGTPAATSAESVEELLFAQTFERGTWAPKPGETWRFVLTLTDQAAQTLYFADRPDRLVGTMPTREVLDRLGFTPEDPPNAAIVAQTAGGEEVLVVELFDPIYAETFGSDGVVTLTYEAWVRAGYGEGRIARWRSGNRMRRYPMSSARCASSSTAQGERLWRPSAPPRTNAGPASFAATGSVRPPSGNAASTRTATRGSPAAAVNARRSATAARRPTAPLGNSALAARASTRIDARLPRFVMGRRDA